MRNSAQLQWFDHSQDVKGQCRTRHSFDTLYFKIAQGQGGFEGSGAPQCPISLNWPFSSPHWQSYRCFIFLIFIYLNFVFHEDHPWQTTFGFPNLLLIVSSIFWSFIITWQVQFSCSVVSDSLRAHGLQHARLPCPSPVPRVYSNSCPLSRWCHPTISSSVVHFSSCLQSFPALGSSNELVLCIRWPKYWSFSFSISPSNEFSGLISFRMDWLDPLAVQGTDSQGSSPAPQFKSINSSVLSFLYSPSLTSIHDYWKKITWQANSKNGNWWTKAFKKYFTPFYYGMLEVYTKVKLSVNPSASHQCQQWLISWNHCVP